MSDGDGLTVYIGYDAREAEAYDVCAFSLVRHATIPIHVIPLCHDVLRKVGIYDRPFHMEGTQRIDKRDGRPFSTEFAFTRFLVPTLQHHRGQALFVDCDFLFTRDIARLLEHIKPEKAVSVVKHEHNTSGEATKMDGQSQGAYPRKNWSSFMLWNCAHPANKAITPEKVNHETGRWLHGLSWLADDEIGELHIRWNWLSGVNAMLPRGEVPAAIHYTLGTPNMAGHEATPYAGLWQIDQRLLHSVPSKPVDERPPYLPLAKGRDHEKA